MIIARKGETIKGRDGKTLATVAEDIHSGDVRPRSSQFVMADGSRPVSGAMVDEQILDFIRRRLTRGAPEEVNARKEAAKKAKPVAPDGSKDSEGAPGSPKLAKRQVKPKKAKKLRK